MCKVNDCSKPLLRRNNILKMLSERSYSNISMVSSNKIDLSLQSRNIEYGLLRKCYSCSQIHVLNGNLHKTKRNSINRWHSDDMSSHITRRFVLKRIDINSKENCRLVYKNSVDMIPELSKNFENVGSESNIFMYSIKSLNMNNFDYLNNNESLVNEDLLSATYSNRSTSVCDGSSPMTSDVSPSDYYSHDLSESAEGENWEYGSNSNSCDNIDMNSENSSSKISKCSSRITLTEELTNYDKNNYQKNRSYRSNSSDSAIILPFIESDFDDSQRVPQDSGCSQFSSKVNQTNNLHNTNSKMDFRGKSSVYSNIWCHSLKTTSGSCPSLETPSVIISDHSTNHYEEKSDLRPCEANTNVLALAIENLLNSHTQTRRDSITSNCSSTSSLSSLGDEDFISENNLKSSYKTPSAWRKVRSLVTSPFIQTYKKQKYPWVQLAGHQGNFLSGPTQGTILKKLSGTEEICFKIIMNDVIKPLVPDYRKTVKINNESYLELQDLLANFENPSIMDIKMGVRTYLEEELTKAREKPKLRKDMYEKMIVIDSKEPSDEENRLKAVTKPRYMIWRETISSTASLGFRIEGIKQSNGKTIKDFKRTKTEEHIKTAFELFIGNYSHCISLYLNKLKIINETLKLSQFFKSHELIGSSLLFVHDNKKADIWLIDFAKTHPLPNGIKITHNNEWQVGNHEDGYLIGLESLIRLLNKI